MKTSSDAGKVHKPERTCIACRSTGGKRDLIRIVRTGEGVQIDLSSKKSGRGAYLCPVYECWEAGIKGNKIEHSLHTKLADSERKTLADYGKTLPKRK